MKLQFCKLTDFDTIFCTVKIENNTSGIIEKPQPFFFVKIELENFVGTIKNNYYHNGLFYFELSMNKKLSIDDLRKKLELFVCYDNEVSQKRVMKIEIVDQFAKQVENITFFPEIKRNETVFRLFSPLASLVKIKFFDNDKSGTVEMTFDKRGFWTYKEKKNLHLKEYIYIIRFEDRIIETIDPFSLSLTANSERSVIIDFSKRHKMKKFKNPEKKCDLVLYETHIRDFTSDPDTSFVERNTYRAFAQKNITKNDFPAGMDHLLELGITHVHLLPIQDFNSVNELHESDYNWGYDPKCYTVPEGSYSSDPRNPLSRVEELSDLVNKLHDNKIGIILDVVYNHTYEQFDSIFNNMLPDYAYRWNDYGFLSNGSGCGNEIATERCFMRKYIIDSLKHWILNYGVDGFRFDLMGLIDSETMFRIEKELTGIEKDIILYGEPWTGGESQLPDEKKSLKGFQRNHKIAVFNDDLRNGLKGFPDDCSKGFISGDINWTDNVLGSMLGGIGYEDDLLNIADNPSEQIVYSSCHDNLTLFDKIRKSSPDSDWTECVKMNKLSAFIQFLSQGIPLLHAGEEFARSKYFHHNTYNLGDLYNSIKWGEKEKYFDLFSYYKNLIKIRKEHPVFRLETGEAIRKRISLIHRIKGAFLYTIDGSDIDEWKYSLIAINMTDDDLWFKLPDVDKTSEWIITANQFRAGNSPLGIAENELQISENSWYLLHT
jgi:pullulanase